METDLMKKSALSKIEEVSIKRALKTKSIKTFEIEDRYCPDSVRFQTMNTEQVRESFLISDLFVPGSIKLTYSHIDRAIIGSAVPVNMPLILNGCKELATDHFAENREIGVMNIGEKGVINVNNREYEVGYKDCLYIGKGSKNIIFEALDESRTPLFYIASFPAHKSYPTTLAKIKDAEPIKLGSAEKANQRTIYKFICPDCIESCQLAMGFTQLEKNSVWNTMPTHTHSRRMEVYMYFELPDDEVVFHFMGEPDKIKQIVVRDKQAVISPSWSIHSGVGTINYSFLWCMGGENQIFTDMDAVDMKALK